MAEFASSFATGFEIGTIIKEKQKAKKAMKEIQTTLQEWKLSGKEPSYVDKLMMGMLMTNVGQTASSLFQSIDNNKASMDREKLAQDAMNLRELNNNMLNFAKVIQTSIEDGTIGLIDWFQFQSMVPNLDLNKFLNKDTITKLQDESTKQEALDNITGVAKIIPSEYTIPYMAGQGVPGLEGLQPTTAPKAPGISDYKGAVDYLKNFSKVTTSPDTFNKVKAGLQNKFPDIDMSDITQESLREPEPSTTGQFFKTADEVTKNSPKIEGYRIDPTLDKAKGWYANYTPEPKGGEGGYRATSLSEQEKYRQNALDANTWEDAEKIIDRYTGAGYDPTEMPDKQEWIDAKLDQLDIHVEMLKEITDEEGKLMGSKKFPFTSGVKDEKEIQTGEAWYKDIYEAYVFYLEELTKMGVDVSKYRKIKSPAELKKGFLGGYPSIY